MKSEDFICYELSDKTHTESSKSLILDFIPTQQIFGLQSSILQAFNLKVCFKSTRRIANNPHTAEQVVGSWNRTFYAVIVMEVVNGGIAHLPMASRQKKGAFGFCRAVGMNVNQVAQAGPNLDKQRYRTRPSSAAKFKSTKQDGK